MDADDDDDARGWQSGTPKQHRARIFELTSGQSLSITQDTSMSAEALWACGAGAVVWEAAEATLAYLESAFAPTGLQGKAVVELGAGTGVVGLACAAKGARVTLTDLETALPLLRANAEQNYAATRAHPNLSPSQLEPMPKTVSIPLRPLRLSWLQKRMREDPTFVLSPRSELPDEAFISFDELREIERIAKTKAQGSLLDPLPAASVEDFRELLRDPNQQAIFMTQVRALDDL